MVGDFRIIVSSPQSHRTPTNILHPVHFRVSASLIRTTMKLSSAMQPLGDIRYGFRAAWKPTLLALWQNPALLLSPAGVSRLFMAHLWTAFATPIDEGNRDLKRSVITANAYGVVLDLGAG